MRCFAYFVIILLALPLILGWGVVYTLYKIGEHGWELLKSSLSSQS